MQASHALAPLKKEESDTPSKGTLIGTIVNALAIIAGSAIGLIFRKGIPERYNESIIDAISLAVILIGIKGAFKSDEPLIVILCLAIGTVIGEFIGIEAVLEKFGKWLETKSLKNEGGIPEGFVATSLLYCVGAMAILGSLESGLTGNHQVLFAKSLIDGIGSIVFASSMGIGVMISSLSVFIYQGTITIGASFLERLLVPEAVNEMSAVGGLLIMALGIKMMHIKEIRVGNMLPALFLPIAYYAIKNIL